MDPNDQFTMKVASVLRRVRNFPLTDAHIWGDAEPVEFYRDPLPHPNSHAFKRVLQWRDVPQPEGVSA